MNNLAFVMYSHSSYSDLWPMFTEQAKKHFDCKGNKYVFVDKLYDPTLHGEDSEWFFYNRNYKEIFYNDKRSYPERLYACLFFLDEDVVLLSHEDMILYDDVDCAKIEEYAKIVQKGNIAGIKLIKGGNADDVYVKGRDDLCIVMPDHPNMFAVQPTLWNRKILMEILEAHFGLNIWDMERKANDYIKKNKIKLLYSFKGEPKRGMLHWDS